MQRIRAIALPAATAGYLLLGMTGAQADPNCVRPYEPNIPGAATATYEQMQSAFKSFAQYQSDLDEYIHCLERERRNAEEERYRTVREWDRAVSSFNAQ